MPREDRIGGQRPPDHIRAADAQDLSVVPRAQPLVGGAIAGQQVALRVSLSKPPTVACSAWISA